MVCLARCPPTAAAAPGQNCYTLPDASDPCCNITVCDEPSLDPDQVWNSHFGAKFKLAILIN